MNYMHHSLTPQVSLSTYTVITHGDLAIGISPFYVSYRISYFCGTAPCLTTHEHMNDAPHSVKFFFSFSCWCVLSAPTLFSLIVLHQQNPPTNRPHSVLFLCPSHDDKHSSLTFFIYPVERQCACTLNTSLWPHRCRRSVGPSLHNSPGCGY